MAAIKDKLSGVFAPVTTPFKNDNLLLDDLRVNLAKYHDTSLAGYLALGSNGEFKSLTESEQFQVLEVFAEEKGDKTVMVGTACESTKETIERTKKVAEMGFDFASILTPSYFSKNMTDDILIGYYTRIAESVTIPILVYNAPGFAGGVQVSPKAMMKLAKHPNIVGMKDSSPAGPNRFLGAIAPEDEFYVLAGSANFLYPTLHLGGIGGIVSLANALPKPCCRLYDLFIDREYDKARELHFRLMRLNGAVSGTHGVAGVKGAMDVCGYNGGKPRHPLVPVTDADRIRIRKSILADGFSLTG